MLASRDFSKLGFRGGTAAIVRTDGLRGLFRGTPLRLATIAPMFTIIWLVYDKILGAIHQVSYREPGSRPGGRWLTFNLFSAATPVSGAENGKHDKEKAGISCSFVEGKLLSICPRCSVLRPSPPDRPARANVGS